MHIYANCYKKYYYFSILLNKNYISATISCVNTFFKKVILMKPIRTFIHQNGIKLVLNAEKPLYDLTKGRIVWRLKTKN